MKKETYRVGVSSTDIYYGLLHEKESALADYKEAVWVVDENTVRFLPACARHIVQLPSGEQNKSLASVEKILHAAIDRSFGRDDTIIGLGGGVICDMAGFAASLYMRGCNLVLIPSTLLAMNDASLGGKTGIDYLGYKNLLGAFYPASAMYVFTDIIQTLTDRDYLSGLSEIIKHALLDGENFIDYMRTHKERILSRNNECLSSLIPRSLKVKGEIVENDAREHGIRAYLNLGHTFGHALETVSDFAVTHGEAVAWGIAKAMEAGIRLNITDSAYAGQVKEVLLSYGYNLSYPDYNPEKIQQMMNMDKKKKAGEIRFVVQRKAADTLLTHIPETVLLDVLASP